MNREEVIRKLEEILICCERYESFEVKDGDALALELAICELKSTAQEVPIQEQYVLNVNPIELSKVYINNSKKLAIHPFMI